MSEFKNYLKSADLLLQYLSEPERYPQIREHIESCAACQKTLKSLRRVALVGENDQLTCGECESKLPDYVGAFFMDRGHESQFSDVKLHVRLCPHCSQHYETFLQINKAILTGSLETPPLYPSPDMSFLEKDQIALNVWKQAKELKEIIIAQLIAPSLRPASAMARGRINWLGKAHPHLYRDAKIDIDIRLVSRRGKNVEAPVKLVGQVIPQNKNLHELEGTVVSLHCGEEQVDVTQIDRYGNFAFEDVQKGNYKVHLVWRKDHETWIQDLEI